MGLCDIFQNIGLTLVVKPFREERRHRTITGLMSCRIAHIKKCLDLATEMVIVIGIFHAIKVFGIYIIIRSRVAKM